MQESKSRFYLLLGSWMFKYGFIGVLLGATAPMAFLLFEKTLFHPRVSFVNFIRISILSSPRDLFTHGFLFCAVFVLGISGMFVGSLRKKDALRRREVEERNMELYALNAVSRIIARSSDLDSLLHGVLKETLSLSFLSIENKGVVFVLEGDVCRMAASLNLSPGLMEAEARIPLGHCLCGRAAQTGRMIVSSDSFEDERHTVRYAGMERHGHIVVPIKGKDRVQGVMCFYLSPGALPAQMDIKILESIASQLSVGMENVKLLQEITRANNRAQKKNLENEMNLQALKSLVEVDRVIMSTRDRDEMLFKVLKQARQAMRVDVGVIALKGHHPEFFSCVAAWGMDVRKGDLIIKPDAFGGPDWQVIFRKLDGRGKCSPVEKAMARAGAKRSMAVPILKHNSMEGALIVGSGGQDGLTNKDAGTAMSFASRIGIALEHARLIGDLEDLSMNITRALASAIDAKSPWTKGHSERVAEYAVAIGERLGFPQWRLERLRLAGLLHDIGKIGTYDKLLDKADKLTPEELELIKLHPVRGCEILEPIKELRDILPAVRHHHERWDGRGYPDGLKGEKIPPMARILCVADSFDTMTDDRPYRPSIGLDNAIQELKYCSGSQFEPRVVLALLGLLEEKGVALVRKRSASRPYSSPSAAI